MTIRAGVCVAAALVWPASALAGGVTRSIAPVVPGPAVVVLDRDVYENARADLGDLRISDDEGR
jgi:hypothetical protein